MGRISDCARVCISLLACITGIKKKEKPTNDTQVDEKVDVKADGMADTKATCCCTCSHHDGHHSPKPPAAEARLAAVVAKGWKYRPYAELPWRLEQVVQQEENWRGIWVPEVKDMQAMEWGSAQVAKDGGRGFRYQRQPTLQVPFLSDGDRHHGTLPGGQDDLMVWLGKP